MPDASGHSEPCCWDGCSRPAEYAITFHGQPGHVHDCGPHVAVLRAWSDVAAVWSLPCPLPHGLVWVDTPRDLA